MTKKTIVVGWINREYISDGETGIIIPVHNISALAQAMEECISGKYDLPSMRLNCHREAKKNDIDSVLTEQLLQQIGL